MVFLDTDRAVWGDPLMEFYFRSLADASPARRSAYRQVCSESGDPFTPDTPGAARRMALYDLYLALILVIESTYRNYSPDHDAWARAFCDRALVVLKY